MIPSGSHQVTPKVWGSETLIANRAFCGKRMRLAKGYRCSLHYHVVKDESFLVLRGAVLVEIGAPRFACIDARQPDRVRTFVLGPGDSIDVPAMTLHRFTGISDAEFVEFSTHDDPSDSYLVTESGLA